DGCVADDRGLSLDWSLAYLAGECPGRKTHCTETVAKLAHGARHPDRSSIPSALWPPHLAALAAAAVFPRVGYNRDMAGAGAYSSGPRLCRLGATLHRLELERDCHDQGAA